VQLETFVNHPSTNTVFYEPFIMAGAVCQQSERRVLLVERLHRGEARGIPRAMTFFSFLFSLFSFYNLLFSGGLSFE
jgi:hypothetical protein